MLFLIILSSILAIVTGIQDSFLPHTYVVEFEQPVHAFATKRHLLYRRSEFYQQLNDLNINYDIRHEYEIINAISVVFKTLEDSSLFFDKMNGIKKSWPVSSISKPQVFHKANSFGDEIGSLFSFYDVTGVLKAREKLGLTGKGIKVGIIDTGVDYMHPALGGCFGENCRVAYGYDFVGDEYDGENDPQPDNDPRDTCNGHGTHVTGIIGAKDIEANFTGVAPEATFGAYRIFGCSGSSSDDMIMKAMERAYLDGMDVINLSLGDVGWPDSPASILADQLALKGLIVCAAAGNEGEKGVFQVGAPSLGRHALSVASIDNTHVLSHVIKVADSMFGYTTVSGKIFNASHAEVVTISDTFGASNEACEEIDVNLKGKFVLIGRGGCYFTTKIKNAQKAGAAGVIVYNNVPGPVSPSVPGDSIKIDYGGISLEDGRLFFQYLKENSDHNVQFLDKDFSFPIPTAGSMSSFSSWGLGPDLSLKPDLSAPGGYIYSTYPVDLGSYATLSGTSMASPFIAGIVALIEESRGGNRGISAMEVRSMLINNGHPVNIFSNESNNEIQVDSVARQGSGLVDLYGALVSDTMILPEQIRLNDIEHTAENNEYTLTIHNNGRTRQEYEISHMVASSIQGYDQNSAIMNSIPLNIPVVHERSKVEAVVEIPIPYVAIDANNELNITVRISPPLNAADVPASIYSGYIAVKKVAGEHNHQFIPYAGLTASISTLPVLMVNDTMPRIKSDFVSIVSPTVLSLQLTEASSLLSISVVDAKDITRNRGLIPGGYSTFIGRNTIDDPTDMMILSWFGNVVETTEQAGIGLLQHAAPKNKKKLQNKESGTGFDIALVGKQLETGVYKLKVMALRPFGDMNREEDYDVWYSPDIQLEGATNGPVS